jgi:hypothetical protein
MYLPLAHFIGFWLRYPDSYPLDAAGPIFCAAITMYSPPCSLYRFLVKISTATGTHWTRRAPSPVLPSPCSHHLTTLQVPGQDNGQLPARSHALSTAITMFSPLDHFIGSWSRYRTATRWMRVPSSVPPSPCTHLRPLFRFLVKIPDSYPLDAAGPIFCAAIIMFSPFDHFAGSWSR